MSTRVFNYFFRIMIYLRWPNWSCQTKNSFSIRKCSYGNNNKISGNTNHILPQSLTSQTGYSLAWMCLLLMLVVWTVKRLPAERTSTIKSAKALKSQISDYWINESVPFNCWGPRAFIESLIIFFPSYGLGPLYCVGPMFKF